MFKRLWYIYKYFVLGKRVRKSFFNPNYTYHDEIEAVIHVLSKSVTQPADYGDRACEDAMMDLPDGGCTAMLAVPDNTEDMSGELFPIWH